MVIKNVFLVLAHKPIEHIYNYARERQDSNFYIHVDKKTDIRLIKTQELKNVFFLKENERVDITWAGFSMVKATLNLINFALGHDQENSFFHLISGDDVILEKKLEWNNSDIYIECSVSKRHQYRMRFDMPHADTKYQRTLLGKALTQFYKKLDSVLPTSETFYFGSQWFSIRRNELQILITSITTDDLEFFRKKLCPDEHFFQYLIAKNEMLHKVSNFGNKRFIKFDLNFQHGSSPIFLTARQLIEAQKENYWFARKVEFQEMQKFSLN